MVKYKGFTLKRIKEFTGREGYGLTCDMYVDNKFAGSYADGGNGAMGNASFVSPEMEERVMHIVFACGRENPNGFMLNIYRQDEDMYEKDIIRIKNRFPYITDDEITPESVSACELDCLVEFYMQMRSYESSLKKAKKKGYKFIGILPDKNRPNRESIIMFPEGYTTGSAEKYGCTKIFAEKEDFVIV